MYKILVFLVTKPPSRPVAMHHHHQSSSIGISSALAFPQIQAQAQYVCVRVCMSFQKDRAISREREKNKTFFN